MKNAVLGLMLLGLVATPLLADTNEFDRYWDGSGVVQARGTGEAYLYGEAGVVSKMTLRTLGRHVIEVRVRGDGNSIVKSGRWRESISGDWRVYSGWGKFVASGSDSTVEVNSLGNWISLYAEGFGSVGLKGDGWADAWHKDYGIVLPAK